jgi:hypothetical protein
MVGVEDAVANVLEVDQQGDFSRAFHTTSRIRPRSRMEGSPGKPAPKARVRT